MEYLKNMFKIKKEDTRPRAVASSELNTKTHDPIR